MSRVEVATSGTDTCLFWQLRPTELTIHSYSSLESQYLVNKKLVAYRRKNIYMIISFCSCKFYEADLRTMLQPNFALLRTLLQSFTLRESQAEYTFILDKH